MGFYFQSRISPLNSIDDDILKIVRAIGINKTHDHDEISSRMIEICDGVLYKPVSLIYKYCVKTGIFPNV